MPMCPGENDSVFPNIYVSQYTLKESWSHIGESFNKFSGLHYKKTS